MNENKAIKGALEKLKAQKVNFGFLERFDVDENWEATKALRKQIPMKPITYSDTNREDCPVCGTTVRGINKLFGDYCSKCGQKLDWSEEDER